MAALGMVMAVLASGCQPGADDTDAASSSSSTVPAPTPAPPSTTAPATDVGSCPGDDPFPPADARDVSEVSADVDGDGQDDRVLSYRDAGGTGQVAVGVAAGGSAVDAGDAGGPEPLYVLGGVALGGDGETVLAATGAGPPVSVGGLFQFVECAITAVLLETGQPVEVPVGGTVTQGDGIECTGGAGSVLLVRLRATSADGETFTTDDVSYQIDGNTLLEVRSDSETLRTPADSAEIQRHYTLDCPGLERSLDG
jgi:hypothetical protein